jgi:hypothetical protein
MGRWGYGDMVNWDMGDGKWGEGAVGEKGVKGGRGREKGGGGGGVDRGVEESEIEVKRRGKSGRVEGDMERKSGMGRDGHSITLLILLPIKLNYIYNSYSCPHSSLNSSR